MSYSQKIKQFRESRGMTHQHFADLVGVSRGAVQQWERGLTAPTRKNQPAVAAFMGITVAELMSESATATLTGASVTSSAGTLTAYGTAIGGVGAAPVLIDMDGNPDSDYPAIKRVNIKASAGVTGYAVECLDEERLPIFFRKDWYDSRGYRPEKMLAVRVSGESMVPTFHSGDLIVINTDRTEPKHSKPFLVTHEGEVVVKRLVRDDGLWWLVSDNADQRRYPRVKCNGDTTIIGEVVYRQTEVF